MTPPVRAPHPHGGLREMVAIALPMVVSQACDTVMIFTDRVYLSKLGPEQMNAAMGGGLTMFMMMSFFIGLTSYATALVAQYLGAGKKDRCAVVLTQALIISVVAYPVVLACRPLAYVLFERMGISPEQMAPQKIFFDTLIFGVIVSLLRNALSCFFSGIGRTGIVMIASATAMVVNVGLNYVLIYGKFGVPALGIRGAALGTIAGGLSGLLVLASVYLGGKIRQEFNVMRALRFDRTVFGQLLRFGSPTGLEMVLNIFAFNALVMIFHSRGLVTATATTIVFNWDLVSFVPLIGVEIAVTSLVGRAMGAGDPETAHRSTMAGLKVGMVYSAFILILFLGFPGQLVGMFRPAGEAGVFAAAAPLAVTMVRVASLYVLTEAMFVIFIGALRGAGDTFWAMAASVSLHWITTAVLFVLLRVMGISSIHGWIAVVCLFFLFSFLVLIRYASGRWKAIKVVDAPPASALTDGLSEPAEF